MLSRIQQCRPKLHATLSCGSPVLVCGGTVYRISRLSALKGRIFCAVLIDGLLRDTTVVIHAEIGSSHSMAHGWLHKRTDYVRESVPRFALNSRTIVPALEHLMHGLTVMDLIDEMGTFKYMNVPLYDLNRRSDFPILMDVLEGSAFTFRIMDLPP